MAKDWTDEAAAETGSQMTRPHASIREVLWNKRHVGGRIAEPRAVARVRQRLGTSVAPDRRHVYRSANARAREFRGPPGLVSLDGDAAKPKCQNVKQNGEPHAEESATETQTNLHLPGPR